MIKFKSQKRKIDLVTTIATIIVVVAVVAIIAVVAIVVIGGAVFIVAVVNIVHNVVQHGKELFVSIGTFRNVYICIVIFVILDDVVIRDGERGPNKWTFGLANVTRNVTIFIVKPIMGTSAQVEDLHISNLPAWKGKCVGGQQYLGMPFRRVFSSTSSQSCLAKTITDFVNREEAVETSFDECEKQ